MKCDKELPSDAIIGIQLFNRGSFFEAHEALESAWRAEPDANRNLYQGILQLGVGYYHFLRGNTVGARLLFIRAQKTLENVPSFCQGIDVNNIRTQIDEASILLEKNKTNPVTSFHFPIHQIEIGQIKHE
jgi:predicted metal-dependent hydrolase